MANFNGTEGGPIPLSKATAWTKNYRDASAADAIKASFFGNEIINDILAQHGCVGIRIYYALDDNGVQQLILTGVDKDGNDLYNGILGDMAVVCPSSCDINSPLFK